MKRVLICAAIAVASWLAPLGALTPLAQGVTAEPATPDTTARVIVKFRAESPLLRKQALSAAGQQTLQAASLGQRIGVALDSGRGITERSHVVIGRGLTSKQLAARIAAQPDVEYAVVDERKHIVDVPNDPLYAPTTAPARGPAVGQWYLRPPGAAGTAANTAPSAINAEKAWDVTKGNTSIVVAVLDTGVRFDHPDLQGGNVLPGYDMISADPSGAFTTANDGDGRDGDASDPGDFVNGAESTASCGASASSWHGTQTLALIGAATHNGVGMASVTHGGVRVMPVRVLGKCGGYDSDIQAGMRWAAGLPVPGIPDNATPARVINMSLGGAAACEQSYIDTIGQVTAAGTTVVASAGNSAGHPVGSPASCPGVIAVAAVRHVGTKVGFSDIGPQITISAPGGNCVNDTGACLYPIITASNSGTTTPVAGPPGAIYTDSFNRSLGTSFSSPLVAGAVGLMLSVQPALTPAQVKAKLQASAQPFPTSGGTAGIPQCTAPVAGVDQLECYCTTSTCGAGMLDVAAAVQSVNGVQASIALTTTTPTANQAVALTSNSVLNAGQSIVSYAWTILNAGTTGATITGASDGASVVVTPTAAGAFVIQLATTDNKGFVSSTTLLVTVIGPVVPPSTTPAATPSGGGGGGGGALGVGWLLLLLGAVVSLALTTGRARVAAAAVSAAARDARRR